MFYWVLLGFNRFQWVLMGLNGFSQDCTGFFLAAVEC